MFDWFKKREYTNVIKFPEVKTPYVKDPAIHYSIGHSDDNRIAFRIGHSTLTMNRAGAQQLIDQLELYQSQLSEEDQ